jgi:hypothetical protein
MANDQMKVSVEDIVASAATGVMRAMEARKVRVDGIHFKDLAASGFFVDFRITAGGRPDIDIFGPRGPFGGGGPGGISGGGGIG